MDTPCYYELPDDIEKNILSFLSTDDLWSMLQVNQAKSGFAQGIHVQRTLEFYQKEFEKSCLWEHLPQIVADGSLHLYFNAFVPTDWLEIIQTGEFANLNSLVQSARESVYSKDLVSDLSIQKVPEAQTFLLTQLPKKQSIKDYLSAPFISKENILEDKKQRLLVARVYRQVEETYNLLLLFLLVRRSSEEKALFFVVDGRLSRWLVGSGIISLRCQSTRKPLLSDLVECSLGKHALSSQCSYNQITLQKSAANILYRLTDNDCWSLAVNQSSVLVDAIERRCFSIIDRLGPRALEYVIEENIHKEAMLLVLLERVGIARLTKILPSLWDVLPVNVQDKFTAHDLLALTAINEKAVPCIIEKGYLESKFTDLKDLIEFVLRYVITVTEPVQEKLLEIMAVPYGLWRKFEQKKGENSYWYIFCSEEFSREVTDTRLEELRSGCQPEIHISLLQKLSEIQRIQNAKKQLEKAKKPEDPILVIDVPPSDIPTASTPPTLPPSQRDVPVVLPKKPREIESEVDASVPVQQNESLPSPDLVKIPVLSDPINGEKNTQSLSRRPPLSIPLPQSSSSQVKEESNWKKWLLYGFLFLAGVGFFLSFLGLLEVSFALKACEAMINLLVECTPQAAALSIFIASALIGIITLVSAQIDNRIHHNEYWMEEDDSEDTCSWNGICRDSENNNRKSTPVFVVKTTAPFKALIDPTSKATSAENSANISCC